MSNCNFGPRKFECSKDCSWSPNLPGANTCSYCSCMRQPYGYLTQYQEIDSTTNQNPPFYKLGPEPHCYRPLYNHTIGDVGIPGPKINYKMFPWLLPP